MADPLPSRAPARAEWTNAEGLLRQVVRATHGEAREGQQLVTAAVDRALIEHTHLLVEAGPGVGKSRAYLSALVSHLVHGDLKRVVIATYTTALQDQLIHHDLPAVLAQAGTPLRAALLKGRGNYLCRARLQGQVQRGDGLLQLGGGGAPVGLRELVTWADRTPTGDRSAPDFPPAFDPEGWGQVTVLPEECTGSKCSFHDRCFAEQARERAADAQIVVVNISLLMMHLLLAEAGLLPEHDAVVIDEAHKLRDVATEAFGHKVGPRRLHLIGGRLSHFLSRGGQDHQLVSAIHAEAEALERAILDRLPTDRAGNPIPTALPELTPALARVLHRADSTLEAVADRLRQIADYEEPHQADAADRIRKLITASRRLMGTVWDPDDTSVRWLQVMPLEVCVTPVSPARDLRARLFNGTTTVILTSATLRIGGNFGPVARMLGVPQEHEAVVAPSPFDYPRQAVLFLPRGMPDPRSGEYASEVQRMLTTLIRAAGGRTLALFTSISAMREAHEALRGRLGVMAYCQGELPQQRLIEAFRDDERSCLFATMGYWQGVDVAGSSLSLVVIDKLPFEPPGHPVTEARQRLAEASGHNAFQSVSLPPVAMTLTQGVGRLIRSTTDTGMVAILDPRLSTARYRHLLLKGLPPMTRVHDLDVAVAKLKEMTGTSR